MLARMTWQGRQPACHQVPCGVWGLLWLAVLASPACLNQHFHARLSSYFLSLLRRRLPSLLQLSEGEAASLGPAWPRPRDLAALLDQCTVAGEVLLRHSAAAAGDAAAPSALGSEAGLSGGGGGGSAGGLSGRRGQVLRLLTRVGHLCAQFLSVVGSATQGGAVSTREQQARDWLAAVDGVAFGSGAGAGGAGPGAGPMTPGPVAGGGLFGFGAGAQAAAAT